MFFWLAPCDITKIWFPSGPSGFEAPRVVQLCYTTTKSLKKEVWEHGEGPQRGMTLILETTVKLLIGGRHVMWLTLDDKGKLPVSGFIL